MLTSVKYAYEAGVYIWPVPFPFSGASQVGVRLCQTDGQERQLQAGVEYVLQGQNIVYLLKPGQSLIVYLDADPLDALLANQSAALSPATPVAPATPVEQPAPIQDTARDAQLAAMQAQIDAMKAEHEQALIAARAAEEDRQLAAIRAAGADAANAITAAASAAIASIQKAQSTAETSTRSQLIKLEVARNRANDAATNVDDAVRTANSSISSATREAGASLAAQCDAIEARINEVGEQTATAVMSAGQTQAASYSLNTQALTSAAGDCENHVAQADAAAKQAGSYAAQAQTHAVNAGLAVADCKTLAQRAQYWEANSADYCKAAVAMANSASRDAWLIANRDNRPGMASVKCEADLQSVVGGCYIINPLISASPTMQYGVWAVTSIDRATWDGFFIIGEEFDGCCPNGPQVLPEPIDPSEIPDFPDGPVNPDNPGTGANKSDWKPCGHTHREEANA